MQGSEHNTSALERHGEPSTEADRFRSPPTEYTFEEDEEGNKTMLKSLLSKVDSNHETQVEFNKQTNRHMQEVKLGLEKINARLDEHAKDIAKCLEPMTPKGSVSVRV